MHALSTIVAPNCELSRAAKQVILSESLGIVSTPLRIRLVQHQFNKSAKWVNHLGLLFWISLRPSRRAGSAGRRFRAAPASGGSRIAIAVQSDRASSSFPSESSPRRPFSPIPSGACRRVRGIREERTDLFLRVAAELRPAISHFELIVAG